MVNTGRSAEAPVSGDIPLHAGFKVRAVILLGWRTFCDERERSRQGGLVIGSVVDGPVGEAVWCREPEPLVAVTVEMFARLAMSVELSAIVGKSQRCSSRRDIEVSVLVGRYVSASFHPHLKAIA